MENQPYDKGSRKEWMAEAKALSGAAKKLDAMLKAAKDGDEAAKIYERKPSDPVVPSMPTDDKPDVVEEKGHLAKEEADALEATILARVEFRQYRGRSGILRPRREAWFGSWDYNYGGDVLKAQPMPDFLQELINRLEREGYGTFNGVLLNEYRDGRDHVPPHSDDDYGDDRPTIPTLVLGAARPLLFRNKKNRKIAVEYLPGHGDLLVMRGDCQSLWKHGIRPTKKQVGRRISLTFRYKPTS